MSIACYSQEAGWPTLLRFGFVFEYLDLSSNNFSVSIPKGIGKLPRLQVLNLCCNLLNETIPTFLGNLSSLEQLLLAYNYLFSLGVIPPHLGYLSKLQNLWVPK